jgi:serine protease Do
MQARSRWRRGRAGIAALVVLVALVSFFTLHQQAARTEAAAHLWTEQPPAVSQTTVPAPPWVELAKALKPAVVNISTRGTRPAAESGTTDENNPLGDYFRQFQGRPAPRVMRGLGSGFIISPDGNIVTNNHVVAGATEIKVTMSDGRNFTAKVVGRDPKTDLALVKIEARNLPVIPLGDTTSMQVGEPVMAIGNPFGLEQTVTTGIVSATGRVIGEGPYDDFIQTDAAINPGNSGGPLINARGQAIGINSAILSRSGGSVGVGFAIPVNLAKNVITQLASGGHVERGWLGVTIQRLTPELARTFRLPETDGSPTTAGALVTEVNEDSPAAKAGLKSGDVILEYNGRKIARSEDLPRAVAETTIGRDVPIAVMRDGKRVTLQARVARMKDDAAEVTQASAAEPSKGALGLSVQTVTPEMARSLGLEQSEGVVVRSVRNDSPAANAGIRPNDVIIAVDRQAVKSADEMKRVLDKHPTGTPTLLLVHRDGGKLYVSVG